MLAEVVSILEEKVKDQANFVLIGKAISKAITAQSLSLFLISLSSDSGLVGVQKAAKTDGLSALLKNPSLQGEDSKKVSTLVQTTNTENQAKNKTETIESADSEEDEERISPAPFLAEQENGAIYGNQAMLDSVQYGKVVEYMKVFYGDQEKTIHYNPDGFAAAKAITPMELQEAEGTVINFQYSTILGKSLDIPQQTRKRFGIWITFNRAMFDYLELTHSLTRDVDYN